MPYMHFLFRTGPARPEEMVWPGPARPGPTQSVPEHTPRMDSVRNLVNKLADARAV